MKVAFISRATLYTAPGGDTKQLDMTAHYLRALDVEVNVYKSNDEIDYSKYDLIHFFNVIRPANILKHVRNSGKPYVVSTIFVDYSNIGVSGFVRNLLRKFISGDSMEYLKTIARAIKNGEQIVSPEYIYMGHRRSVKYIAENAAILLPNSESEYKRFEEKYGVSSQYRVIPNGINEASVYKEYPADEKYKDAIICMARIEPMKNQHRLIAALNNTKYKLYIHGKPAPNHVAYYETCIADAADNVYIGEHLGEQELFTAYSNAKVHVLPSYFETTGLSSLEAAAMGCNIVVTAKGDTKDYFKDAAWYCDPDNPTSIKDAIDQAYNAPYNEQFRQRILKEFTWKRAAEETLAAYQQVLKV